MNSEKDTLWLSELTEDFLNEAIIWPKLILKPLQLIGIIFTISCVFSFINEHFVALAFSMIAVVFLSKKVALCQEDIILITNELTRRERNAKKYFSISDDIE